MTVHGFLLIDILLGLAIMSICSLTLVMGHVYLIQQQQQTYYSLKAVSLARNFIEKIQADGRLPSKDQIINDIFTITWHTKMPTKSLKNLEFEALQVKVSWPVGSAQKSVTFDTGVLLT